MVFKIRPTTLGSIAALAITTLAASTACYPSPTPAVTSTQPPRAAPTPIPSATSMTALATTPAPASMPETPDTPSTPTSRWFALLQRTPYPYSAPLPPATSTILDGTYTKVDPYSGQHVPCKRCPAYPPGGGIWRLNLDKGIFRVHHEFTDWVTIGSFTVSEDTGSGGRIEFSNDPHCFQDTGVYTWTLEERKLTLEVVEDNCGVYLRKQNLVALPWASCQPPSEEAAITNHWPLPPGCEGEPAR